MQCIRMEPSWLRPTRLRHPVVKMGEPRETETGPIDTPDRPELTPFAARWLAGRTDTANPDVVAHAERMSDAERNGGNVVEWVALVLNQVAFLPTGARDAKDCGAYARARRAAWSTDLPSDLREEFCWILDDLAAAARPRDTFAGRRAYHRAHRRATPTRARWFDTHLGSARRPPTVST